MVLAWQIQCPQSYGYLDELLIRRPVVYSNLLDFVRILQRRDYAIRQDLLRAQECTAIHDVNEAKACKFSLAVLSAEYTQFFARVSLSKH